MFWILSNPSLYSMIVYSQEVLLTLKFQNLQFYRANEITQVDPLTKLEFMKFKPCAL